MKKGLLVVTHGQAGLEMLKTSEMIMGKQEDAIALCFLESESVDLLDNKFKKALEAFADTDELLCFVDIQGGTPFNVAMSYKHRFKDIIFGINIPLLLETLQCFQNQDPFPISLELVTKAKEYIGNTSALSLDVEDEEF